MVGNGFTNTICEVDEEHPVNVFVPVTWYKIGAVGVTATDVAVPSDGGLVHE